MNALCLPYEKRCLSFLRSFMICPADSLNPPDLDRGAPRYSSARRISAPCFDLQLNGAASSLRCTGTNFSEAQPYIRIPIVRPALKYKRDIALSCHA